jgi:transcriptional regulator with XRE-family HTH domain
VITDADLGLKLRLLLEVKKVSRKELVDKLNKILPSSKRTIPFTEKTIWSFETGKRNFSVVFLLSVCEVLKTDIRFFTTDISKLLENREKIDNIFDSRHTAVLYSKFNNLIKILDVISDPEISKNLVGLLEHLKETKCLKK